MLTACIVGNRIPSFDKSPKALRPSDFLPWLDEGPGPNSLEAFREQSRLFDEAMEARMERERAKLAAEAETP